MLNFCCEINMYKVLNIKAINLKIWAVSHKIPNAYLCAYYRLLLKITKETEKEKMKFMTTIWCLDSLSFGLFQAWKNRVGIQSFKFTWLAVTEFRAVCLSNWEVFWLFNHSYTVAVPTLVQTLDSPKLVGRTRHNNSGKSKGYLC